MSTSVSPRVICTVLGAAGGGRGGEGELRADANALHPCLRQLSLPPPPHRTPLRAAALRAATWP